MNSQLYQTDSCVVLCVANCRGKLWQLAKLASDCSADAVLHIGDFGLTKSSVSWSTRTPDTTPSFTQSFSTPQSVDRSWSTRSRESSAQSISGQQDSRNEIDDFLRGSRQFPVPLYVISGSEEENLPNILNISLISGSSNSIRIPKKSCVLKVFVVPNIQVAENASENTAFLVNELATMLACAAEPPSSNQEIRVLVSDYDIGNFVSNLGCHVEASVIISSMPSNQLFQTDILNRIREVLTSQRSIVSNAFHQKLFGILELSRSGQFEQELPLSVDLKHFETRNLQIRSSNDQVSCIVTDIGRRRYRTLSCLPTEVTTLKSDDNFKSNPRPVSNSWDYASRSTDITPSNASSPGDWIHESSQAIMRPASVKSVTDTSTIFKTEFDTLSDMTEVSEMEATGISTVLVGNFPDETTEAELKYRFRNVNILRCKIVNNKKADRKPFAFLDVKECDRDAVLKMNGERFHGLKLKVEYDPSRLEKLGRKRSDSVKLEMSSIVVADTPVPSIPHTLKKSNSLNALEFYTSSNPQANSAMAFRPNSQVPKTGTMIRTRSQLLNSTQLAQNYESWMEPNNPESSSSPSLTQSYLPPMTLHQSPVTAKSSLALKSSWDSPPRKKDTFTTGASWEKVESNNSNQSCSKNNLPPSWSINVRADSTGVDLNQWDQPQRHVAYRTNSNSSSVDQSEYSTYSSPDNFHLPAHSGSGPVDVGRTHWGGAPSQLMKLPGDQWGESITPMDRRDFNSLTSIDHRRLSQTRETSMKTNAMASVMSFNQQLMSGVGLATGAGLTEGHRRPSLVNLSAFSHGPSVEYDAISSWYPPNIETAVENGGMAGFVKRGNSGISGVSGWQPHQPSTKSLYEKNIW